ncbi:MAG: hypothetical protein RBT19_15330, partial [Tenuifilaceae bacterium]|nr:hypothetical protein [Tenuifilaceae bacterium]
ALNAIYAQAVTEWEVTLEQPLDATGLTTTLEVNTTDYSEDMRAMMRAYVMQRNTVPGTTYLFIVPGFKDNPSMVGYMPLKSNYGFLTPQATTRDAAHELGHGVFNLRHTFSTNNMVNLPEGSTQNLMDYSAGTELFKYQWDFIHNPEGGWFVWEDSEEGMAKNTTQAIVEIVEKIRCGYVSTRPINFYMSRFTNKKNQLTNCRCFADNHEYKYISITFSGEVISYKLPTSLPSPQSVPLTSHLKYTFGNISITIHSDDRQHFEDYIYPKNLNTYKNQVIIAINQLASSNLTNDQKLRELVNHSQCVFESLTVEQRQVILHWIAGEGKDISENIEDIVINVIRTVHNANDARKLIDYIAQKQLMANFTHLTKGMNDVGGKPNYTQFVSELFKLYRMAYDDKLKDIYSTDVHGTTVTLNGEATSYGALAVVKYPPFFNWATRKGANLHANGNVINLANLKSLGEVSVGNQSFNSNTLPVGAFDVVVVRFTRNIFLIDDKAQGADRIMAMPAFVLQWLCLKELKADAYELLNTSVTVASMLSSFGAMAFLTRSIGVGSRLWALQQRLTQLVALKNTISVALLSDDCEEWIKQTDFGIDFIEYFKVVDVVLNIGGESAIKSMLRMGFVDEVSLLVAGWEAVKLRDDVGQYFDKGKQAEVDNFLKDLLNLAQQINGELSHEVH